MAMDKKELIELYKTTLEEARHRDRLYTQTWMAVAITGSVFFAAAALFLKQPPIIPECCMTGFRIGFVILGTCLAFFFTYSVFRFAKEKEICCDIARKIECKFLHGEEQSEGPKLEEDLLIRHRLSKIEQKGWCDRLKWAFSGQGWRRVYPSTIFLAWIAFCIFLFICID